MDNFYWSIYQITAFPLFNLLLYPSIVFLISLVISVNSIWFFFLNRYSFPVKVCILPLILQTMVYLVSMSPNFNTWICCASISIFFPAWFCFLIIFIECWIVCQVCYRRSVWCYRSLKRLFFSFLAGSYNRSKSLNPIRDWSYSRLPFSHCKVWFVSSVSLFLGCSSLGDPKAFGVYHRALSCGSWTPTSISSVLWNYW